MIQVIGYNEYGYIVIVLDGTTMTVPDNLGNRHRRMVAEWEALENTIPPYVPPVIDLSAMDQAELNHALAQEGSVVRALALVMLQEINILRVRAGLTAYTQPQLVSALKAKMR